MKHIILIFFTLISIKPLSAQSVTFNKHNYDPGDAVVASLSIVSGKTITGYESDFDQQSHQAPVDPQKISLGNISKPGVYAVSFSLSDGSKEVYNFIIFESGNNTDAAGSSLFVNPFLADPTAFTSFYQKFVNKFKSLDWGDIMAETGKEYLLSNAINASFTLVVCIGTAAQPELIGICGNNLKDVTGEFAVIVTKQIVINMAKKGFIDDDTKKTILSSISGVKAILSIMEMHSANNRDFDHLFDAVARSADVVLGDGSAANILVQQNQQLFKQTRLLINIKH